MKKKTGYTLIEIMVVVAATGLIMTAMVGMILGTFRAQNRTKSDNKITETGSWIINELRKNVFNSDSSKVSCIGDSKSVVITNLTDGKETILSCNENNNEIASTSATPGTRVLNNKNEVTVLDCDSFVGCEKVENKVTGVTFNFMLGSETKGIGSSKTFTTRVTVRN
jgi:prepilin-type N-terminal cleavage/methylation domain-containing protein